MTSGRFKFAGVFVALFIFLLTLYGLLYFWDRPLKTSVDNRDKKPKHPISYDKYKLRKTPENQLAKEHALFTGCSFTFGHDLEDKDTLPFLFQEMTPGFKSYNMAISGGGIHSILYYTELNDLKKVVKEEKGIMLYVFISHHLDRYLLDYSYIQWAYRRTPTYESVRDEISFTGFLKDQFRYKLYHFMKSLGVEHILTRTETPSHVSSDSLSAFIIAVRELKRRYLEKFPKGQFVFVFHPLKRLRDDLEIQMKTLLTETGIEFLDTREFQSALKEPKLDDAYHPNAAFNHEFARYLSLQN